ncbi:MAG: hypothetical protein P3W87_008010 [Gammaproteobacteria bacterium]|nr:hypothetical protein [Gammaproteobacteria bacterium]
MKRWPRLIFPLLLVGLLSACANKPSERELRTLLAQKLCKEGFCKVENLHKQNGYWKDDHRYVAEVRYELVFTKSLREVAVEMSDENGRQSSNALAELFLGMVYGDFKAGDRLPREEAVTLLKTEQGWRLD